MRSGLTSSRRLVDALGTGADDEVVAAIERSRLEARSAAADHERARRRARPSRRAHCDHADGPPLRRDPGDPRAVTIGAAASVIGETRSSEPSASTVTRSSAAVPQRAADEPVDGLLGRLGIDGDGTARPP